MRWFESSRPSQPVFASFTACRVLWENRAMSGGSVSYATCLALSGPYFGRFPAMAVTDELDEIDIGRPDLARHVAEDQPDLLAAPLQMDRSVDLDGSLDVQQWQCAAPHKIVQCLVQRRMVDLDGDIVLLDVHPLNELPDAV